MPFPTTPGVYVERARPRPVPMLGRTDVAGFVGLAERGPLHEPVRLTSGREFRQVFGDFLPYAHLAYAVRGFFDNGGAACWVVRVADAERARSATAAMPAEPTADGVDGGTAYRVTARTPGAWGDRLTVRVQPAQLGTARQDTAVAGLGPASLAVDTIAGFEVGSVVRLGQSGNDATQLVRVAEVDPLRRVLRFTEDIGPTLDAGDAARPILIASLELTLLVLEDGQVVERLGDLAPAAAHSRDAVRRVAEQSRWIVLERTGATCLLPDEHGPVCAFPALGRGAFEVRLSGGRDGLASLDIFDHVGTPAGDRFGLAALDEVDEVAMLAMPDLGARPRRLRSARPAPPPVVDPCDPGAAGEARTVEGIVTDAETGLPLAGVTVDDGRLDGSTVTTDASGAFTLDGLQAGATVDVLLTFDGYADARLTVNVDLAAADGLQAELVAVDLPPVLDDTDIFFGQQAMISQCVRRRDRVAILEAPFAADAPDHVRRADVLAWRARFASPYAALYHPWLVVRDPLEPGGVRGRFVPPSGHVAGLFAAFDREEGVHRPPANRALAWTEDVALAIDDVEQGLLNPLGINAIRAFPGRGIRVFGARTLAPPGSGPTVFVNVRRLLNAVIETVEDGLRWAVFEPHDAGLRLAVEQWLGGLANALWRRGALVGDSPEAAYAARADDTTTTEDDVANGRLIARLDLAPVVPYEFVVVRLGLTAEELRVSEAAA